MMFTASLFVLCCSMTMALQQSKVSITPTGIGSLDIRKYTGLWYIVFIKNPCGWKGADEFTDWTVHYTLEKGCNNITVNSMWRSAETCVATTLKQRLVDGSTLIIKDTFGDVTSSRAVVVATDYRNYIITWGCVKPSVDPNECDDYWMSAKFRQPYVPRKLHIYINLVLIQTFGITTKAMVSVQHNGVCLPKVKGSQRSDRYMNRRDVAKHVGLK